MEETLISVGHGATKTGAGVATGSGLLGILVENQQVISLCGILIGVTLGVVGFAIQSYYQRRRDRRDQEFHAARMARLNDS